MAESLKTVSLLRSNNKNAIPFSDTNTKLNKQFKFANLQNIPYVIIIGPEEVEKDVITLKDMQTGSQVTDILDNIIPQIK